MQRVGAAPEVTTSPSELSELSIAKLRAMRQRPVAACKVCGADADPFDVVDFRKTCAPSLYPNGLAMIPVMYRRCRKCRFIFTDFFDEFTAAQWRAHVYNAEYVQIDPDYASVRPRNNARELVSLLAGRKEQTVGLDYGGGNGRTAELMRENGWRFDSHDPYGKTSLTAAYRGRYNVCSAFEVFEHSTDPVGTLRHLLEQTNSDELMIFLGTGVHDHVVSERTRLSWWYVAPRNGHVSIYSRQSLISLGRAFGLTCTTLWPFRGTHLLTRGSASATAATLWRTKLAGYTRTVFGGWSGRLR